MKRITSILLIIITLAGLSFSLVSCGGNKDGVPDGMQLIRGGDALGYYFYGPEEWTVSNLGDISAAYASKVDNSSISYAEFTLDEGKTLKDYFNQSLSEFTVTPTNLSAGEPYTFGNADEAIMFTFEFEYSSHKFRTMQILASFQGRHGIFTYTSFNENMSSPDTVQFDFYKEKIRGVTDNFKFVSKNGNAEKPTYDVKDEDGYLLVSDKDIAGYELYLPQSFAPDYSSGIVTARAADGATVTMSRATATGVTIDVYWTNRRTELEAFVTDLKEIKINDPISFGNSNRAFAYEYTYVFGNETYHVWQVMGVTNLNGYVLTYTAKEAVFESHRAEIEKIIAKVKF